mmetsp:Transcript_41722/g.120912  ORF Transcript_41722/g.120912 Transcript_41722/m.120912 type:complete len:211 (+) Transcript_41722:40-672(+)
MGLRRAGPATGLDAHPHAAAQHSVASSPGAERRAASCRGAAGARDAPEQLGPGLLHRAVDQASQRNGRQHEGGEEEQLLLQRALGPEVVRGPAGEVHPQRRQDAAVPQLDAQPHVAEQPERRGRSAAGLHGHFQVQDGSDGGLEGQLRHDVAHVTVTSYTALWAAAWEAEPVPGTPQVLQGPCGREAGKWCSQAEQHMKPAAAPQPRENS